jgi:outer membrane protein
MSLRSVTLVALCCALFSAEESAPRSLSLRQVLELSAATRAVDIAQLDTAIARAGLGEQRVSLLPQIDATAGLNRHRNYPMVTGVEEAPANQMNAQLRLGQSLFDLAAWHRTKAASRQLVASEAAATVVIEQATLAGALAYIDVVTAKALIEVRRDDLRLAEDLQVQADAQVEAGTSERISATRAANQVETARSTLVTAEGLLRRATINLARTLDLPPGHDLVASEPLSETLVSMIPDRDPDAAEAFALENRTELRVSAATLALLEEQRQAEKGAGLPRLDAFVEGGYGGYAFDEMDPGWRVGVALVIPIVDAAPYRQEQAKLRVAQQHLRQRQVEDKVRSEVRQALNTIETVEARLASDRNRRALADAELDQAKARFDAGAAGNLEVIDAQRGRTSAQVSYLGSLDALIQARIRLIAAMGSITALH